MFATTWQISAADQEYADACRELMYCEDREKDHFFPCGTYKLSTTFDAADAAKARTSRARERFHAATVALRNHRAARS